MVNDSVTTALVSQQRKRRRPRSSFPRENVHGRMAFNSNKTAPPRRSSLHFGALEQRDSHGNPIPKRTTSAMYLNLADPVLTLPTAPPPVPAIPSYITSQSSRGSTSSPTLSQNTLGRSTMADRGRAAFNQFRTGTSKNTTSSSNQINEGTYRHYFRRYNLMIEYTNLSNPRHMPKGMYIMPVPMMPARVWHGVLFVKEHYYKDAILRFRLHIPDTYPTHPPTVHFLVTVPCSSAYPGKRITPPTGGSTSPPHKRLATHQNQVNAPVHQPQPLDIGCVSEELLNMAIKRVYHQSQTPNIFLECENSEDETSCSLKSQYLPRPPHFLAKNVIDDLYENIKEDVEGVEVTFPGFRAAKTFVEHDQHAGVVQLIIRYHGRDVAYIDIPQPAGIHSDDSGSESEQNYSDTE